MDYTKESCRDFVSLLASDSPAPGGGGAAAIAGALGAALGEMVAALTVGKKRYASVEAEIKDAATELERLRNKLLDMVMEDATLKACTAPYEMMKLGSRALKQVARVAEKGSVMAVSDAGCAAAMIKAAVDSAALNVYINTKSLKDRERAESMNTACLEMQDGCALLAEEIYTKVKSALLGQGR